MSESRKLVGNSPLRFGPTRNSNVKVLFGAFFRFWSIYSPISVCPRIRDRDNVPADTFGSSHVSMGNLTYISYKVHIPNIEALNSDTHTFLMCILILNSQCVGVTIEGMDKFYSSVKFYSSFLELAIH